MDTSASPYHPTQMPETNGRPLRVLLTGNSRPWELSASYKRAFSSIGHDSRVFDWYGRLERWARLSPEPVSKLLLIAAARRRSAIDLLVSVQRFQPDLLVLLKTDDLPRGTLDLARTAAPRCRIVAFHPDDPFNRNRFRGPSHPRAHSQIRAVDHYFIWSHRIADRLRRERMGAVSYLGFSCDPEFTRPIEVSDLDRVRFGADVSFVGNWDPKREAWLAPLAHATDMSLAIWGTSDWGRRVRDPRLAKCWRGLAIGDDFVRAVVCSRVSVNILRLQNETAENMRTYEIPACGGVMLAERSEQQSAIFRDGVEAVYASDPLELIERARELSRSSPETLSSLSAAALGRAAENRYRVRAQAMLDTIRLSACSAR
jgi:spore maturation protein CgeB